MQALKKYKNIFLIVVLAIVVFVGYRYFFSEPSSTGSTLVSQGEGNQAAVLAERELLATLLSLKKIKLDESLFDDPAFQTLEDFSQELQPQVVGRGDPFAPIGVGVGFVVFDDESPESGVSE